MTSATAIAWLSEVHRPEASIPAVGLDDHGGCAEAARRLGISGQQMSRLLSGKANSGETLERLAAIMTNRR